ncbi:MAG: hypothetical protein HZA90_27835 [Verrucomicrobia bacterium]|nr:hypothetical protein [Verrucomicrobiota bacterium]
MNHPSHEDLIGFLYEELPDGQQAETCRHVAGCAQCRAQVESWRAVRRELLAWAVPDQTRRRTSTPSWLLVKWAAAAVVLIGAGFALARGTAPATKLDTAAIRAAMAQELRQELRSELARFAADQATHQQEFQSALTRALGRLEAQRLVDYASLRQDVETVAVRAEDELQSTRLDLARLANPEH